MTRAPDRSALKVGMTLAALSLPLDALAKTIVVEDGRVIAVFERKIARAKPRPEPAAAVPPAAPRAEEAAEPEIRPPEIDPDSPLTMPLYPAASRRFEEEGKVVVRVLVLPNGKVGRSWVAESSGHHRLDDAATQEAYRWRFRPATRAGVAVAAERNVVVRFGLSD